MSPSGPKHAQIAITFPPVVALYLAWLQQETRAFPRYGQQIENVPSLKDSEPTKKKGAVFGSA
jgi:hypothetical protein